MGEFLTLLPGNPKINYSVYLYSLEIIPPRYEYRMAFMGNIYP